MSSRRSAHSPRPPVGPAASSSPGQPAADGPARPGQWLPGAPRRRLDRATALAVGAVGLAAMALVVTVVGLVAPGRSSCQAAAWDAIPAVGALPADWTISSTDFYVDGQTTTLAGPASSEGADDGALLYASITCYGSSGADAIARSRTSVEDAGMPVDDLDDIGESGYAVQDATTGSQAYHFRRGGLVAYLAVSGSVSAAEMRQVALAVDASMLRAQGVAAGTGPTAAPATSAPSAAASELPSVEPSAVESAEPTETPIAPELEALLPDEVDGTPLVHDSTTGDYVLGDDTASRALTATLRDLGKAPADLRIAQGYDETGALDIGILAFRVPGVAGATLRDAILETWLFAGAAGVTSSQETLGGKEITRVSYGDEGSVSYVYLEDDAVLLINTADEALAGRILASQP